MNPSCELKKMATLLSTLLFTALIAACSSSEVKTDSAGAAEPAGAVEPTAKAPLLAEGPAQILVPPAHTAVIEKNSSGDSDFAGLYNTFELKATILNSTVREALITRQSEYFQWDASQKATERERATQEMSSETTVFLSFSTPERKNDNLSDAKSIWRLYIDVGGRRYIGKAKRDRRLIAELQAMYPYHTRWNSPYLITFPVATTAIESQPVKFTLTGPMGTRVLEFAPASAIR